ELVWNRAIATQMKEAEIKITKVFTDGTKGYRFESYFQKVLFDGFLKVLSPEFVTRHQSDVKMKKDEPLTITEINQEEKETLPPPRYSEATLIKVLEEHGIGRPSTYAAILSLIQEKGYVERDGRYLKSTPLGEVISDYLSESFPELFSINFTAGMEEELDKIAEGDMKLLEVLSKFYGPFKEVLKTKQTDTAKIEVKEEVNEVCPKCGKPLQVRFSKFGKFYACSGYPDCKFTKPFLKVVDGKICPKDGGNVVVRYTRAKKKFYGCVNYPACDYTEFVWSKLVAAPGAPGAPVAGAAAATVPPAAPTPDKSVTQ
ncbi:topoisomerase DNA-binding C4 zinc finger domain-containing protein, partial [Candidatus Microgenomates bacterium]|nr:topoisomerase DNA-binding C4 zinc finger domain-containing protein [Candidatus Microgenomates bacterium]